MARTERYFIGPKLLGDIRETITRVAGMPDAPRGSAFPVRLQEINPLAGGNKWRACGWTGTWNLGETKQIVLYRPGEMFGSEKTTTALNTYIGWRLPETSATVAASGGYGMVYRENSVWNLRQIEPTTIQGWNELFQASSRPAYSVLGAEYTDEGVYARWFSVTSCGTTAQ